MKLFIKIDLAGYFGAERRTVDGEDGIFIPLSTNRSIIPSGGKAVALFHTFEMRQRDADGNTMLVIPFLTKKTEARLARADIVKMTAPIGKIRVEGAPTARKAPAAAASAKDDATSKIGHSILAPRPVTDNEIPL